MILKKAKQLLIASPKTAPDVLSIILFSLPSLWQAKWQILLFPVTLQCSDLIFPICFSFWTVLRSCKAQMLKTAPTISPTSLFSRNYLVETHSSRYLQMLAWIHQQKLCQNNLDATHQGWEGLGTKGKQLKANLLTFCTVFDVASCDVLTGKIRRGKGQNHLSYSSIVTCYEIRVR